MFNALRPTWGRLANWLPFEARRTRSVGLDLGAYSIKLAEVRRGLHGVRLEGVVVQPTPVVADLAAQFDATVEAIAIACQRLPEPPLEVVVGLPAAASIARRIELPTGLSDDELEERVEEEAEAVVPLPLDEVNLDFQVLGPSPGGLEILLVAVKRDVVEERLALVESAGLRARIADLNTYADYRAWSAQVEAEGGTMAVVTLVDLGWTGTRLSVLRGSDPLVFKEHALAMSGLAEELYRRYPGDPQGVERMMASGDYPASILAELVAPWFDRLAQELLRTLDFHRSSGGEAPEQIVLCGGGAAAPLLAAPLADRSLIAVRQLDPFPGLWSLAGSAASPTSPPLMTTACGLALRGLA